MNRVYKDYGYIVCSPSKTSKKDQIQRAGQENNILPR